ncbi:hypothetical protein B4168_3264 [Anoxybacillus flavithermus]|nr:hypothetical protein B4168_3264 [Anoxybacillus flavithermus]OAO85165.1 hypothetical protein GT23_3219 [Parageobacillus thermoglucosidasius]
MWPPCLEQRKEEAAHIIVQESAKPVRTAWKKYKPYIGRVKYATKKWRNGNWQ